MKSNLEITTVIGCKNMCSYCPQKTLLNAYKDGVRIMSFDTFKQCIDKVPLDSDIHFTGMAEPFLNQDCFKMIEYTHQRGHEIMVSTTLVGLKDKDIVALEKISFKSFWVHLPSSDTNTPIDDDYLKRLKELSESKINVTYIYHKNLHPKINLPATKSLLNSRAGNLNGRPRRKRGEIACKRVQPVLLPNGDVVLCCMDYGLKHILGNLLRDNYEDLFLGSEYQKILKGWKNPKIDILCRNCEFARNINFTAKIFNSLDLRKTVRRILRKLNLPTA